MEAPLAYWLSLVERLVETRISAILDEHGVTRIQWRALSELEDHPLGLDLLERAAKGVAPADADETMASAVAELVDSGWIGGTADAYLLTASGSDALHRMSATVAELRALALSGIRSEDEAIAVAVLQRIAENLDETP